jgi:hypothetical protein
MTGQNPFLGSHRVRQDAWRQLRTSIQAAPTAQNKITQTLDFWKQAPLENHLLDWDNCKLWPTPWELLHNNRFCESSLSLAVAYTLVMSDPDYFPSIQLVLITDRKDHVQKIVVQTHDHILNYGWLDQQPTDLIHTINVNRRWCYVENKWQEQPIKWANLTPQHTTPSSK